MSFWCGGQLIESSSDQVPWWDYGVGRPGWDNEVPISIPVPDEVAGKIIMEEGND